MDTQTIALIATLSGLALATVSLAAGWLWHSHSTRQQRQLAQQMAELGRSVGRMAEYLDGLPQAKTEVRDAFKEGLRLQQAEEHEAAIAQLEKALAAAQSDSQRCALHILTGNSLAQTGRFADAEAQYRQALASGEKGQDKEGCAWALGNLGNLYGRRSELDKAEEYHKRALAIHRETGNRLGQATALGNLGVVYYRRRELDKAEGYHKKSLDIHRETGNRLGQAYNLGNLGNVHVARGELDKAQEHYEKVLAIHEDLADPRSQANALDSLGLVYALRGDLNKAADYVKRSLEIRERIADRLGQAEALANLGLLQAQRAKAPEALRCLCEARRIFAELGLTVDVQKADDLIRQLEPAAAAKPERRGKKPPPKAP